MKRLLLLIVAATFALATSAQETEKVISINAASFRPVQTDALTGIAIDPIGLDGTKRPCTRLKMRINRMTREDIAQLQFRLRGGVIDLRKCQVAHEGNGLIIEMTAYKNTVFYLQHPHLGMSNEVTIATEGNKEYYIEASLNQLYSIIVQANAEGVEVYIDNELMGHTNSEYTLNISDVLPGEHTLRLVYGSSEVEQKINVQKNSILFRGEVNLAGTQPQYVVFDIKPKEATLIVNGEPWLTTNGVAQKSLKQGVYNYTVELKEYHSESGTFTVKEQKITQKIELRPAFGALKVLSSPSLDGATIYIDKTQVGKAPKTIERLASGAHKVGFVKAMYKSYETTVTISDEQTFELSAELQPNFAPITLTAADNECEIWINDQNKGKGRWSGNLEIGSYNVVCKKVGHRNSQRTVDILSTHANEFDLPAPLPIYGRLKVECNDPIIADVTIDGVKQSEQTPFDKMVLVGEHKIVVSKEGHATHTHVCRVEEGQTVEVKGFSLPTTKEVRISCNKSSASVYVDNKYLGSANKSYSLPYGEHEVKVSLDGYTPQTKHITINNSTDEIEFGTLRSSRYSSSYSSSSRSSSKSGSTKSLDTISNFFSLGLTGNYLYCQDTHAYEVGVLFRIFSYNSRFNTTVGMNYLGYIDGGSGYLSIPFTVNLNIIRGNKAGWFVGVGGQYDYAIKSGWDNEWSVLAQTGIGFRHFELKALMRYYVSYEDAFYGAGVTYYF